MKKIYVGNLSFETTDTSLRNLFSTYGNVSSATILTDRETGRSRGFGFVEMEDDAAATAAIQALNGHNLDGRSLNVNEAPSEYDPLKLTDRPSLKSQRIWLDAGDEDYCQPGAEALHTALDASEVAHDYHVWPGAHEDSLWAEYLPDYLQFYTLNWPK